MIPPINPSTNKVDQSYLPLSLKPSSPSRFPISYSDGIWDIVDSGSELSILTGKTGQFDQHTINELFGSNINEIFSSISEIWDYIQGSATHNDFTDDFTEDFD